jgi:hypothetical protein
MPTHAEMHELCAVSWISKRTERAKIHPPAQGTDHVRHPHRAGGVASVANQIARNFGAIVFAAGSPASRAAVERLHATFIDSRAEPASDYVRRLTNDHGFDHRQWIVHVSLENLLPSRRRGLFRCRFRLFVLMRRSPHTTTTASATMSNSRPRSSRCGYGGITASNAGARQAAPRCRPAQVATAAQARRHGLSTNQRVAHWPGSSHLGTRFKVATDTTVENGLLPSADDARTL